MKLFLTIIVFVLLVVSCSDNNVNSDFGTIRGKVYDSETNELLNLVELSTNPPTSNLVTNQTGSFKFENILNGDYQIKAIKEGYKSKEIQVKVLSGKETVAEIYLVKGSGSSNPDTTDNPDLDNNIIAYYKFDNDVKDYSGNKLDGKAYSVSFVPDRKSEGNKAIEFKGTSQSYVDVPYNSLLNPVSFTYMFWINPNPGYGTDYNGFIDIISRWGHWGQNNQSFAFSFGTKGAVRLILYDIIDHSDYSSSANYSFITSNSIIPANKWTHVAIVHDANSSKTKIIIDGNVDIDITSLTPQPSGVYGLRIGNRMDISSTFLNAKMDDLIIYNKALSQSEIQSVINK